MASPAHPTVVVPDLNKDVDEDETSPGLGASLHVHTENKIRIHRGRE